MTIRVLVTGFSVFPGAPCNSSETLVRLLAERRPSFGPEVLVETALLETSYKNVPLRLAELAARFPPDIALHFGLARSANGFRLERSARNRVSSPVPDVAGYLPAVTTICDGPKSHASSLPLDAIHAALLTRGIPAEFSDDTGGYVCNFTFYHARGGLAAGFRPEMCGFIHIPYLEDQVVNIVDGAALPRITENMLWSGALAVIETCVSSFAAAHLTARSGDAGDRAEQDQRAVT